MAQNQYLDTNTVQDIAYSRTHTTSAILHNTGTPMHVISGWVTKLAARAARIAPPTVPLRPKWPGHWGGCSLDSGGDAPWIPTAGACAYSMIVALPCSLTTVSSAHALATTTSTNSGRLMCHVMPGRMTDFQIGGSESIPALRVGSDQLDTILDLLRALHAS